MTPTTLIDKIEQEMLFDTEDRLNQSARLAQIYYDATEPQRRAIDRALICICGYSLLTLLQEEGLLEYDN